VLDLEAGLAAAAALVAAVALAQADLPAESHHASHCWNIVFAVRERDVLAGLAITYTKLACTCA